MNTARPRILVIRGGAIGDFILTLPALAALRRQFPQARITVLGYPHIACLAVAGGWADDVHPIEARDLAAFFAPGARLPAGMAAFFGGCAVILSYLYDPDGVFQTNVRQCTQATYLAGPHRPDEDASRHATEALLEPLTGLAVFDADPVPRLTLTPAAEGLAPGAVRLALHPGSGSERKNWPEPRWTELVARLAARPGLGLLLVGGEAEGDRLERLAALATPSRLVLARSLPLPELARRLAGCTAFVGHDSGITHLAAALGLPGVVLWGDTHETVWRPRSDRMCLLRAPGGLGALGVDAVEQALAGLLPSPARS